MLIPVPLVVAVATMLRAAGVVPPIVLFEEWMEMARPVVPTVAEPAVFVPT